LTDDLQKRIQAALANPQNMGEMAGADSIGTVGNADCGEMLRLWVKFKQQDGKRVIDRATFQSFGCETAIAVASLATELIRGKTAEEALALKTEELAGELGPLPPMKIHCAQLVEGALRSALEPQNAETKIEKSPAPSSGSNLLDSFSKPKDGVKLTFLDRFPLPSHGHIVRTNLDSGGYFNGAIYVVGTNGGPVNLRDYAEFLQRKNWPVYFAFCKLSFFHPASPLRGEAERRRA
jgi:nitrogen fixation NifU-like protein